MVQDSTGQLPYILSCTGDVPRNCLRNLYQKSSLASLHRYIPIRGASKEAPDPRETEMIEETNSAVTASTESFDHKVNMVAGYETVDKTYDWIYKALVKDKSSEEVAIDILRVERLQKDLKAYKETLSDILIENFEGQRGEHRISSDITAEIVQKSAKRKWNNSAVFDKIDERVSSDNTSFREIVEQSAYVSYWRVGALSDCNIDQEGLSEMEPGVPSVKVFRTIEGESE